MNAKEEAQKLVDKFKPLVTTWDCYWDAPANEDDITIDAKKCALIAVDLHLDELSKMKLIFSDREIHFKNWQQIKQEIEKL